MSTPAEIKTKVRYIGDGSTDTFAIPFEYLHQDDVHVYVDGQRVLPVFFVERYLVVTPITPSAGSVVEVSRHTPKHRLVDFLNTTFLNERTLDLDSNQLMYLIQETLGIAEEALGLDPVDFEYFDAKGRGIKNLKDPVEPKDAANKEYVDTKIQAVKDALEALDGKTDHIFSELIDRLAKAIDELRLEIEFPDLSDFLRELHLGVTVAKQEDLDALRNEIENTLDEIEDTLENIGTGQGNDFTDDEKNKLKGIEQGAQVNKVHSVAGKTGHVILNKGDVGLGSVQNYGIATEAQAKAGTSNDRYMTPLRVAQAIASLSQGGGGSNDDAPKMAVGMYAGSGTGTLDINTGFRPGFVFILTRYKASRDSPTVFYIPGRTALMVIKNGGHRDLDSSYITATNNGFRVGGTKTPGLFVTGAFMSLNAKRIYHYFAIG